MIVTGRKPARWHCGETVHFSDYIQNALPLTTAKGKNGNSGSFAYSQEIGSERINRPLPPEISNLVTVDKSKEEWLTVGKCGRKIQPSAPQVDTNSLESPPIYAVTALTRTSTTTKGRCTSSGWKKFEKFLQFKKRLNEASTSSNRSSIISLHSVFPEAKVPKASFNASRLNASSQLEGSEAYIRSLSAVVDRSSDAITTTTSYFLIRKPLMLKQQRQQLQQ